MKLRAPEGCTGVSHEGRQFKVAGDGSLDAEDGLAEVLAAHGFRPWRSPTAAGEAGVPAADDVDGLSRSALFALLRKRGVRLALPITNAELRAAARQAPARD